MTFTDYGKDGDPTDSLSRYPASLEARCYGNMEEARRLWVNVMTRHGKQAQYWMEYAEIERCVCVCVCACVCALEGGGDWEDAFTYKLQWPILISLM